jgi:DNA replication and repair protein RecF
LLTSVSLFAFRNYTKQEVSLRPGVNLFLGANAQGKTNLLEAIYFAATGRSPRSALLTEMVMWEESGARVVLEYRSDGNHVIEVRLERDAAGGSRTKRTLKFDDRALAPAALAGRVKVVLFHPEEMTLIRGSGEPRRRLVNGLLSQWREGYAAQLSRYGRVLEQRNQLLKRVAAALEPETALDWWTEELARVGGEIMAARREALAELAPRIAANHRGIAGEERLDVRYAPSVEGGDGDDAAAISAALRSRLREELARGMTVAGPHRDDVAFDLGGLPAASHASQGQQRTAILAFKLAEVEALAGEGDAPVLLLDDVMSELDAPRRAHLLSLVEASPQAVITSAEEAYFPPGFAARVGGRRVVAGSLAPGSDD